MWCCCCWCRRRRRRRPIHHRPRSTASHIIIIIISHLFVCMYVCNKQSNSSSQEFCKADPFLFFAYFSGSWVVVFLETGSSLQAQNQFAASKQSKATRRTRKLWTWPKSHTESHTDTHIKNTTPKCFCFCVLEERIQAWSWIIWASFCLYGKTNKSNPSCKNPNSF